MSPVVWASSAQQLYLREKEVEAPGLTDRPVDVSKWPGACWVTEFSSQQPGQGRPHVSRPSGAVGPVSLQVKKQREMHCLGQTHTACWSFSPDV